MFKLQKTNIQKVGKLSATWYTPPSLQKKKKYQEKVLETESSLNAVFVYVMY